MFGGSNTGFGGFGQQQQQQQQPQQNPLFGGGAFGQTTPAPAPAFGQQPQQGFGGFGAAPAGNTAFATPAPAFGSTGGMFGAPAATGFSFGATNTGFGAPAAAAQPSGGLFGAKPATPSFGSAFGSTAAPGGLFGQGSPTTFGATAVSAVQGTANPPYQATSDKDPGSTTTSILQSISAMPAYKQYSFEELRLLDYAANRKFPATSSFAGSSAFGVQQPAFGSAQQAPASNIFGAQPNAFGTPAQAPRVGFGATPTSGGLFGGGGFGSTQPQQQPQQAGLFGAAPPAQTGGLFGGGGGFGAPAVPAFGSTAGGGLFGQAAKPATSTFNFAQPAAPAMGAGGGLFGQQPQAAQTNAFGQPAAAGGLFGQPSQQPAAAPGGFSFGDPKAAAANPFGAPAPVENKPGGFSFSQPAAGGGLFGSQPAQTGFGAPAAPQPSLFGGASTGFGQPAAPAFGGGLFSKPAAPVGGSLFGSAPSSSLFGSTAQPSTGLFGGGLGSSFGGGLSTASQQQQQQQLQQQQQQQQQQSLFASVDDNAYGSNPLFANTGAQAAPVNLLDNKKKPPISTAFRSTPKSTSKIVRLRGFGASSMASPGVGLNGSMSGLHSPGNGYSTGTPGSGRGSPLHLVNGIGEDALLSSSAFVSKPSVKKLVIDRKSTGEGSFARSQSRSMITGGSPDVPPPKRDTNAASSSSAAASKGKDRVTFNPELDYSSPRSASTSILKGLDTFGSSTPARKPSSLSHQQHQQQNTSSGSNQEQLSPPSANDDSLRSPDHDNNDENTSTQHDDVPTEHGEYYTIPSLHQLHKLPAARLQSLSDFVVGRVGFGTISFHDPVNLTTLSSVDRLLGDVVIIEDRNCTVYPADYEGKPSAGDGLNVPATVVLERCWPVSKATREPIKKAGDPKLVSHIKRLRNLEGAKFIDFELETGKWTFEVDGF